MSNEVPIFCSFDYAVSDRQDKLIMLRHYQENKELVMTINYKGLFVLSAFISNDGARVHIQDQAIKFNDFKSSQIQKTDACQDRYYEVLLGKHLHHLFTYLESPVDRRLIPLDAEPIPIQEILLQRVAQNHYNEMDANPCDLVDFSTDPHQLATGFSHLLNYLQTLFMIKRVQNPLFTKAAEIEQQPDGSNILLREEFVLKTN